MKFKEKSGNTLFILKSFMLSSQTEPADPGMAIKQSCQTLMLININVQYVRPKGLGKKEGNLKRFSHKSLRVKFTTIMQLPPSKDL